MEAKISDRLIMYLASHKGKVMTFQEIMKAIPDFLDKAYIAVVVSELRCKGYQIETMRGVGYRYTG